MLIYVHIIIRKQCEILLCVLCALITFDEVSLIGTCVLHVSPTECKLRGRKFEPRSGYEPLRGGIPRLYRQLATDSKNIAVLGPIME